MSTNHTTNYDLCQWEATDQVLRTDFNQDNAKIDAALAAKAELSNHEALAQTVSGLSATVEEHTAAIAKLGNCQVVFGTYIGTGTAGASHPNTLSFPHSPVLIAIRRLNPNGGDTSGPVLVRGATSFHPFQGVANSETDIVWGENSVSWYSEGNNTTYQQNILNATYAYAALLQMGA